MGGVLRTGITLPKELALRLDQFLRDSGIRSRSKVISEALRMYLAEREWIQKPEEEFIGALVVLYNHKIAEAAQRMTEVEHHMRDIILSTLHIHLDERTCLEVIAIKGKGSRIGKLIKELENHRGVEVLRCTLLELSRATR